MEQCGDAAGHPGSAEHVISDSQGFGGATQMESLHGEMAELHQFHAAITGKPTDEHCLLAESAGQGLLISVVGDPGGDFPGFTYRCLQVTLYLRDVFAGRETVMRRLKGAGRHSKHIVAAMPRVQVNKPLAGLPQVGHVVSTGYRPLRCSVEGEYRALYVGIFDQCDEATASLQHRIESGSHAPRRLLFATQVTGH